MTSKDKAIIVVSFGTSYNDNRRKTIGAIEEAIAKRYPDWDVRRAFTSRIIIKKIRERDNEWIDYVDDAMDRLVLDGVKTVIVQPTHVMNGMEYDDVTGIVYEYYDDFDNISIGEPLLTSKEDYDFVIKAIGLTHVKEAEDIAGKGTAVVLMGHGTEHYANATYSQLYLGLQLSGYPDVYVTTVEGFPTFEDTVSLMKGRGYKNVVLFPFMLVAGDHANNDMAGDDEDSLKSVLEAEGYNVHCVVKGLAEYPEFRELLLMHLDDAMEGISSE